MGISFETSHQPDDIPDFRTPSPQLTSCSSNNSNSREVSKAPSKIGKIILQNERNLYFLLDKMNLIALLMFSILSYPLLVSF